MRQSEHMTKDTTLLVATVRNEGPNILEWVAHHRLCGFDRIQIFQNDSTDNTVRTLRILDRLGVIEFFQNNYRVFVDNGAGGGNRNNRILDGSERVLRQRQLPSGVQIESSPGTTFFNPRGRTGAAGTIVLLNTAGARLNLIISPMGRIRLEEG